jgi:hypothetical protein
MSIGDAKTFYFYDGIPCVGKEERSNTSLPTQYVWQLTQQIRNTNRNVTVDNWFTSLELADELIKIKLTLIGTLMKNKAGIPAYLLQAKGITPNTSSFAYLQDKMMVSYVPKKNKVVLLCPQCTGREYRSGIKETRNY